MDATGGWRVGPPDFVGVGAQRAGTSWWFDLICAHAGVWVDPHAPKERHFFDGCVRRAPSAALAQEYARLFPRPAGAITGEWTPRYMYDFWTPPLLAAVAPAAKLLVLLREPLARLLSGAALQAGQGRAGQDARFWTMAAERGLYAPQLERLLEYVDRDRLLVLQYERCVADPAGELARTFEFLGLDPDAAAAAPDLQRRVHASDAALVPELPASARTELSRMFAADRARLLGSFPEIDPGLWQRA